LAGRDKSARLWNLATNTEERRLQADAEVRGAAFAPDGKRVCLAAADGSVRVFAFDDGQQTKKIDAHPGGLASSVAFSPDGTRIMSGGHDGKAFLWNAETGARVALFDHRNPHLISGVAISTDGQFALTASHDQTAILWEAATGVLVRKFEGHKAAVNA